MNQAHRHASLVGTTLGDYELSAPLGGGPWGHVFLAKHRERDFACAVKVFDGNRCGAAALQRVAEVGRAAAALPDARAIPLYEASVDGPDAFFALELAAGESLESVRRRGDRLAWSQARGIFLQVSAALAAADHAGLVHGNLKPSNIRISTDPAGQVRVRLLDWGLAQLRGEREDEGTRIDADLAVVYQAPEQLQGSPPSHATDLYVLGLVLFEALTGQRPFQGPPNVVAMQHLHAAPPSPRTLAPELPAEAESLLLALLDKEPRRRVAVAAAHRPAPVDSDDGDIVTEVFQRSRHASGELTAATATLPSRVRRQQAETVVLHLQPPAQPQDDGAVTVIIPATQGQYILETDPGVPAQPVSEVTSVVNNPSATVFVKQMPPMLLRPPSAPVASPAPAWQRWLKGPWTLEKKLITINILFGLVILAGLGLFAASRP